MTVLGPKVFEVYLLTRRPWKYTPKDAWRAAKLFEKDFKESFTTFGSRNWLGKSPLELDMSTLHNDWTYHAIQEDEGYRVFIIPKENYSAFLDDLVDGIITSRFS